MKTDYPPDSPITWFFKWRTYHVRPYDTFVRRYQLRLSNGQWWYRLQDADSEGVIANSDAHPVMESDRERLIALARQHHEPQEVNHA